jgi:transcriptional regulator with XRE-family HTH domain
MGFELMLTENWILINQREKLGLSQEEVAAKAGITLEQYQRFESGDRNLSSSSFQIVNAVLTTLELDITAYNKGEYALAPLPNGDPLNKILEKI